MLFCIYADEDSNGEIDQLELKHCFQNLGIESTDEEIKDLFQACDIYEHMGMKFNEFIVFLCLVYLLNDPAVSEAVSLTQYNTSKFTLSLSLVQEIHIMRHFFKKIIQSLILSLSLWQNKILNLWYVFT